MRENDHDNVSTQVLFNYVDMEDFFAALPIAISPERSRDLFADLMCTHLEKMIIHPIIRHVREQHEHSRHFNLAAPAAKPELKVVKFKRELIKQQIAKFVEHSKSRSPIRAMTAATITEPGLALGEWMTNALGNAEEAGLIAEALEAGAAASEGAAIAAGGEGVVMGLAAESLLIPGVGAFIAVAALLTLGIFFSSAEQTLEQEIAQRQREINDEYDKIKHDHDMKGKKLKDALDRIRGKNGQISGTRKKTEKKKKKRDETIAECEKHFIGVVDRVTKTYDSQGRQFYEISVDALKLQFLLVEGSNKLYTRILEGASGLTALNEMLLHSYMVRIYTEQFYEENMLCVFECEEHPEQAAPPEGILGITRDLSDSTAIIDKYNIDFDWEHHKTYIVADSVYGYVGKSSRIKTPEEAAGELLMKKVALKTIAAILQKVLHGVPGSSLKELIEKFLQAKKSAPMPTPMLAHTNTTRLETSDTARNEITKAIQQAMKNQDAEDVLLCNIGQGSCVSVRGAAASLDPARGLRQPLTETLFYYDFGYGSGTLPLEERKFINDQIYTSLRPDQVIILSHWDYDHYRLAIGKGQSSAEHASRKRKAPDVTLACNLSWIAPTFNKTGVLANRVKSSIKDILFYPEAASDYIRIRNVALCKASMPAFPLNTNNNGICLMLMSNGIPWFLHPADASYFFIPGLKEHLSQLTALVATHHASTQSILSATGSTTPSTLDTDIPEASGPSTTVYYSYGEKNPYGHAENKVSRYYEAKGWKRSVRTFDATPTAIGVSVKHHSARVTLFARSAESSAPAPAASSHVALRAKL